MQQIHVKRVLRDGPLYKVVETLDGQRVVMTGDESPLSSFANLQMAHSLDNKVAQLVNAGALSEVEANVLDKAIQHFKNSMISQLADYGNSGLDKDG